MNYLPNFLGRYLCLSTFVIKSYPMKNIFEKILYGVKVANDNIIVLNEKIDAIAKLLSYEEGESIDAQANKKTTAF